MYPHMVFTPYKVLSTSCFDELLKIFYLKGTHIQVK